MAYIILVISIIFATANNALYHKLNDEKDYNPFFFTAVSSIVWAILMLPNKNIVNISSIEILFGILYGVVQAMFLFFKMKAMSNGPVSVTSVVGNCSMILTTVLGVLIFNERVSVLQIIGVCIILLSVILCLDPKSDVEMSFKWKIYCILFFVLAASVGIIFKFFSKTESYGSNMMLIASLTMLLLLIILSKISKKVLKLSKKQTVIALLCGIVTCGYNRFNVYLSGALPSVVFFPIFNGSIVLFSTLVGFWMFKEKLSLKQVASVVFGLGSIVLISGALG